MSFRFKVQNNFVLLGMSIIVLSMLIAAPVEAFAQDTEEQYSGEEIFGAIALGQGDLAKEFPDIWSDEMYEEVNNEENSLRAEAILDKISQDNPEYLNELENAVYNEDFNKVNQLLEDGDDILKEASEEAQNAKSPQTLNEDKASGQCAIFAVVYLGAAVVEDAAAWTREYAWTSDDDIMGTSSELQQQEVVSDIITAAN